MAIIRQIDANREFLKRVQTTFKSWCTKKAKQPTQENLVKYLVRGGFIKETIINRFLSIELYRDELPKTANRRHPAGRKIIAIYNLEDKLPLSTTQIKSNVYFHAAYFKDRVNRLP